MRRWPIFFFILLCPWSLLGQSISSSWQKTPRDESFFVVDPTPYLSRKQKKLIYSGFPAYSLMTLVVENQGRSNIVKEFSCAIEYDLWEERFTLLFSSEPPRFDIKTSQDYFDHCLSFSLNDSPQIQSLLKGRSSLKVRVVFTQISGKTNSQITTWLVQQQSTVIKGLFSHMLGELKLEEAQEFAVVLPKLNTP